MQSSAADRVRMLRRFIVVSTSRAIGFQSAPKHCADRHKAGRSQIRGSTLFGRSLPTTHPLPLVHGTSARSVGSSHQGKATPVYPHMERHELPVVSTRRRTCRRLSCGPYTLTHNEEALSWKVVPRLFKELADPQNIVGG